MIMTREEYDRCWQAFTSRRHGMIAESIGQLFLQCILFEESVNRTLAPEISKVVLLTPLKDIFNLHYLSVKSLTSKFNYLLMR